MLYLTDKYPQAKLGPLPGEAGRGAYLSWLSYYQGIMEPLLILQWAGIDHPVVTDGLGDMERMLETLSVSLRTGPWLLSSPFQWFGDALPAGPEVKSWVERCAAEMAEVTA